MPLWYWVAPREEQPNKPKGITHDDWNMVNRCYSETHLKLGGKKNRKVKTMLFQLLLEENLKTVKK